MSQCSKFAFAVTVLAVFGGTAFSQTGGANVWQRSAVQVDSTSSQNLQWLNRYQSYHLDLNGLKSNLASAPHEGGHPFMSYAVIDLPTPAGSLARYMIEESPIMSNALAQRTAVKTYRVKGLDDPLSYGRLDLGPNGFHGLVLRSGGSYVIDPIKLGDKTNYVVYYRSDSDEPRSFICFTQTGVSSAPGHAFVLPPGPGDNLKTYRLAMNATGEYTTFYGSQANAMNGVITSVNRCNAVYEIDLAIHMNLVYNMCYTNAATDPFTNNNGGTMLGQNQTACDTNVGNANYDIGHVFSTGGGGIAGLRVVGVTGQKARGVTGSPSPIGDGFDIDYVAHEMGHQYGANHTFNGTTGSCGGGNRAAVAAYEPGSGSTIMAYAGICGAEDLQPHSDAYFHYKSIEEIYAWRNNAGSGGTTTATGNSTPTVNAGADFTIPQGTPFKLTATASDANGDPITYCWEQYDLGTASPTGDNSTRPLFRSFNPTTNPVRFAPRLPDVLSGAATPWEILPLVNRVLTWRCTVRDNRPGGGGYATDVAVVNVSGSPFSVTAPNTAVTWPGGSTQTVTWNVGGGSVAANVRIYLSTDGGNSYGTGGATVLLASTPNDGSETVTVPNVNTTTARIIVEGVGNIFYDVSNVNFSISTTTNPVPTLTSLVPNNAIAAGSGFSLTVNGTNFVSTSKVRWNGSDRTTTFGSATQLTATIPASDIATVGTASVTVFNPAPGGGTSNALTFTINPIQVNPAAFSLGFGSVISGGLAELISSDDARLVTQFSFSGARGTPNVRLEVSGNTPSSTASRIDVIVEAQANVAGLVQVIRLFNNSTSVWDQIDSSSTALSDTVRTISVTTGANNYRGAGGIIQARVEYSPGGPSVNPTVQPKIDQVHWTVYP